MLIKISSFNNTAFKKQNCIDPSKIGQEVTYLQFPKYISSPIVDEPLCIIPKEKMLLICNFQQ